MEWREFFMRGEDYKITAHFYECDFTFTLEEMYRAFRERVVEELSLPAPPEDE